ncbi:glycosyltransferase [Bacillus salipaludis]|uniref:glycosyltransferase n=1 Tax=Bacillus salipaludis TaxID=2547811 RepID=UPI003D1AF4AA
MISVILPVYNGEKFIAETIDSILNQTEKNLELIIVNDGSTDNSEDLIKTFNDSRIRYFKQENRGVASAFNEGLTHAKGDFITFHGADDLSLPNRFERMLEAFFYENIGYTHSDMLLITEDGSPFGYWQSSNILPNDIYSFFLNVGTPYNIATIFFRKEVVKNILYDESIKVGSDTDYILKVSRQNWPSFHVPEPLYLYRRHQKNVTNERSYDVLSQHVKKNISDEDLNYLTDVGLNHELDSQQLFFAKLIAGVALSRRWMFKEAYCLFIDAIPFIKNEKNRIFYEGMKGIVEKDYQRTVNLFSEIENRNHLEENYLGEALLALKQYNEAYTYFLKALEKYPKYQAPIQNIKAIGMLKGLNVIDQRPNKFK